MVRGSESSSLGPEYFGIYTAAAAYGNPRPQCEISYCGSDPYTRTSHMYFQPETLTAW